MLILISPAKKLTESGTAPTEDFTQPDLLEDSTELATILRNMEVEQLRALMKLSSKLATLNAERYQKFTTPFTPENARPALFTFDGDVYSKMDIANYSQTELTYAQNSLRILSGLYGVLRPLDLMQPYRLEMGTPLASTRGRNIYEFWGNKVTDLVKSTAGKQPVINLASQEYSKVIDWSQIPNAITIDFKQLKYGELKTFGMLAKRARGMMVDFAIKNQITDPQDLQKFNQDGYKFQPQMSDDSNWTFVQEI